MGLDFLGGVYRGLNRYNDAIEAYRQALRIDPKDAIGWLSLGDTYYRLERYNDAIEAYRQALRIDPEDASAWKSLGDVTTASSATMMLSRPTSRALRIECEGCLHLVLSRGRLRQPQALQ